MAVTWEDRGIVLSVRRHGESDAILNLLTEHQGRHAGMVKGGGGRRQRGTLQAGNLVHAQWRARIESQLGTYTVEAMTNYAGTALSERIALAGLSALCAMIDATLPEREPHPSVFAAALELLTHLGDAAWGAHYVHWELGLLRAMGYGLDLRNCAATGVLDDLGFVSPRSGRAVSRAAAGPYRERLLALPPFLLNDGLPPAATPAGDVRAGLALTGYFFDRNIFAPAHQALPLARTRLVDVLGG